MLIINTVYLECRAKHQAAATNGAAGVLNFIKEEWFNHPNLLIENKYHDTL